MSKKKKTPPAAWRSRIVGEGFAAPDQLLANPENFRIHTTEQGSVLDGALDEIGWIQRIIVNEVTGHVIDGHLRVQRALRRGEDQVPVLYVNLTENEERIALATIDPIAAMAGTDNQLLADLLSVIEAENKPLLEFLQAMTPQSPGEGGSSSKPAPGQPTTVWGEIINLGPHRLLCGDIDDQAHRLAVTAGLPGATVLDIASLAIHVLTKSRNPAQMNVICPDPVHCDDLVEAWETTTGKACERIPPN